MKLTDEIKKLAGQIEAYRMARGWSYTKLVGELPETGSAKTFRDLLAGETAGYNEENQLSNLRAAARRIANGDLSRAVDPVCPNLLAVREVRRLAFSLMQVPAEENARVGLVLGSYSTGKSTAARELAREPGRRALIVEVRETMGDRPGAFLDALLDVLGKRPNGRPSAEARMAEAVAALSSKRRCLLIDEAHHCGPRILNTIKALVNDTPGEFVLLAIPSLWNNLRKDSFIEARQIEARMAEVVELEIKFPEIAAQLSHLRPDLFPDASSAAQVAAFIEGDARETCVMAFTRDFARALDSTERADVAKTAQAVAKRKGQELRHARA